MKTIKNPQGGKIVFGPVDGVTTEAAAMGSVLHAIHEQYQEKPQVGKVFQIQGTNSVAVFFTGTRHAEGNLKVAGLLIATNTSPSTVEVAVLTDEASHFGATINPQLKTLFMNWHPAGRWLDTNTGAEKNSHANSIASDPVPSLQKQVAPDNSAMVSIPTDWKVQNAGQGTIFIGGPNGEQGSLGFAILALNSNDPRVRQTMQFAQGAGRNTAYAHSIYYPYGADMAKSFADLLNMNRRQQGLPADTIQIASQDRVPAPPPSRCVHLTGQIDPHDNQGSREFTTIFCQGAIDPTGGYLNVINQIGVPIKFAEKERATASAILSSFSVNQAVVNQQAYAIAKPAIDAIHEIGRQSMQRAADSNAAFEAHNQAVYKQWDSNDKRSQAFSNLTLDQTVIQDNQLNAHGTMWNQTAEALVKSDPNRFEYVQTPNFWKGIDY